MNDLYPYLGDSKLDFLARSNSRIVVPSRLHLLR